MADNMVDNMVHQCPMKDGPLRQHKVKHMVSVDQVTSDQIKVNTPEFNSGLLVRSVCSGGSQMEQRTTKVVAGQGERKKKSRTKKVSHPVRGSRGGENIRTSRRIESWQKQLSIEMRRRERHRHHQN